MSLIVVIKKKIIDFLNFNSIDPITVFRLEFGRKKRQHNSFVTEVPIT